MANEVLEANLLDVEVIIKEESSDSEYEDNVEYENDEFQDLEDEEENFGTSDYYTSSDFAPTRTHEKKHVAQEDQIRESGHLGSSIQANTMTEIFRSFVTPEMVNIIVEYTNQKAQKEIEKWNLNHPQNLRVWTLTDDDEIYAFVGLSLIIGALKAKREPVHILWTNDPSFRRSIFQGTFSKNRFQQISSYIRFDNGNTRQERKLSDKLAPIRQIFDMFAENCRSNYNSGPNLTLDEQLIPFRGSCPFRIFKLTKPGKYGLKLWILADSTTSYCKNLQVYLGKEANKNEKQQIQPLMVEMVSCLEKNSCITNNSCTTIALANELLQKELKMIGLLRKYKDSIPVNSIPFEKKLVTTYSNVTLIHYMPKKDINLTLLSTEEPQNEGENIILNYSCTKGAVDTLNKLIFEYSSNRQTKMWPKVLFMNLIDIAGINSFIIWMEKNISWQLNQSDKRRRFLLELGKQLVQAHVSKRFHCTPGLQRPVVYAMCQVIGEEPESKRFAAESALGNCSSKKAKGRCFLCLRKKDRKTTIKCTKCERLVCREHSTSQVLCARCQDCT